MVKDPQKLFTVLQRLTPRMYSIASSQLMHPDRVETTVRVIRYDAHGRERQGSCQRTHGRAVASWLDAAHLPCMPTAISACQRTPLRRLSWLARGQGLPRSVRFLKSDRQSLNPGKNWLFFGDQRAKLDYLYQEQLEAMHKDGVLTHLDTAFSRDQI